MAKTAIVIHGHRSIASRIFSLIPSLLDIQLSSHVHATLQMMPGWLRRHSPVSQDRRLGTLLRMFQHHNSSELHDRAYALLGLASDARRFPIDYGIPLPQLALNLAVFLATGSLDHGLTDERATVSFEEVLRGLSDPEGFLVFIFGCALKRQEEEFLLLLLESAQHSQRYRLLGLVSSRPGIDSVTSRLMTHPDLNLEAPNELNNTFYEVVRQEVHNAMLLERIIGHGNFIITVDNVQAIADSGPKGILSSGLVKSAVKSAIKSSLLRQVQRFHQDTSAEDYTTHANHAGQIELWIIGMLPLVLKVGDVDAAEALLEQARYPYLRHKKQALSSILHSVFINEDRKSGLISHAAAELLILHGAEVEPPKDGTGPSPLWTAAMKGRLDLVRLFLDNGGNQERAHQGLTPIETAARWGSRGVVDFLLGLEAQSGKDCARHQRSLLTLTSIGDHDSMFKLPLAKGADTNLKYLNMSPLISVKNRGQTKLFKQLLEDGIIVKSPIKK
ncbi:HET-domain-containing protein [Apiospora aurea]|uniref:HET-domain-containing protein n=1 Tax=Apiospora aurea TaxID=335848 RepID=A0ABR1Q1K7_9PEZI